LRDRLSEFFHVEQIKGFNQSLLPTVDDSVDEETARSWVAACEDQPQDATGLIALVRKQYESTSPRTRVTTIESTDLPAHPTFRDVQVVPGYNGRSIMPGEQFDIVVPPGATRCSLIFWSHDWSGVASIMIGTRHFRVDLYSHAGGCQRQVVDCARAEYLTVQALSEKNPRSQSFEVILLRAVFAVQ